MICPHCRDVASFKEHRDKGFTTLLGEVRVEIRPYLFLRPLPFRALPRRLGLGIEPAVG